MKTLADRLKERMKELKITQTELARIIGVAQPSLQSVLSGKTKEPKKLLQLAQALRVSPNWLATGNGDKLVPLIHTPKIEPNAQYLGTFEEWDRNTPLNDDEIEIPFYKEIEMSAGNGKYTVQIDNNGFKLRFSKATLKRQGVQFDNAYCVTANGDSMEPVMPNGCTVGIDSGATMISDGKIYAIDHDGWLRIKLLYRMPNGGIRMRSFNSEAYPDEIYTHEQTKEIRILGKVFWYSVLL